MSGEGRVVRLSVADPEAMHRLGVRLGGLLTAGDLVLLTGPLGAGKTTLTRGIGEGLGVRGPVQSPTFVLARTHPSLVGGAPLVHVDAYRLGGLAGENDGGADELDDLDLDFEGSVVVAEWGAGVVGVSDSWIEVVIERPRGAGAGANDEAAVSGQHSDDDTEPDWGETIVERRTVTVTGYGPRWGGPSEDPLAAIEAEAIAGDSQRDDSRDAGEELR